MSKENVINLKVAKEKIEKQKKTSTFKTYLKNLKQEQLHFEANYLLTKAQTHFNDEILEKSALLLEELAKRINAEKMSSTINRYAENLKKQIESSLNSNE